MYLALGFQIAELNGASVDDADRSAFVKALVKAYYNMVFRLCECACECVSVSVSARLSICLCARVLIAGCICDNGACVPAALCKCRPSLDVDMASAETSIAAPALLFKAGQKAQVSFTPPPSKS